MASELSSTLIADFKRVEHMALRLRQAGQEWIRHYLIFTKAWLDVYERARKGKHAGIIEKLKSLGDCEGNRIDGSVVSKFKKIVGQEKQLLVVGNHLPPAREALYEFVCSYEKNKIVSHRSSLFKSTRLRRLPLFVTCADCGLQTQNSLASHPLPRNLVCPPQTSRKSKPSMVAIACLFISIQAV